MYVYHLSEFKFCFLSWSYWMETEPEDTLRSTGLVCLLPSQTDAIMSRLYVKWERATDLIWKGEHLYLVLLSLRRCREKGEAGLIQASPPSPWVRALAPPWTWTNIYCLYNPESLQSHVFILGQRVEEQTADKQNQTQWLCNSVFGLLQTGSEVPWRQKSVFTSSNQSALGTPCMPAELKEGMKTSLLVVSGKKTKTKQRPVWTSTKSLWINTLYMALYAERRGTKCREWERLQPQATRALAASLGSFTQHNLRSIQKYVLIAIHLETTRYYNPPAPKKNPNQGKITVHECYVCCCALILHQI